MKETGLMFKAPLVRAILEGRKTQTRRILKPQPAPNHPHDGGTKWIIERGRHTPVGSVGHLSVREKMGLHCPMGQPGDRIYVRETFAMDDNGHEEWPVFRADNAAPPTLPPSRGPARWKPAIHMPKDLARIWLEITGVRVERLRDISRADVEAEGVKVTEPRQFSMYGLNAEQRENMRRTVAAYQFQELWESTGGDWAANPWVWVIDFKTISTTGRPA